MGDDLTRSTCNKKGGSESKENKALLPTLSTPWALVLFLNCFLYRLQKHSLLEKKNYFFPQSLQLRSTAKTSGSKSMISGGFLSVHFKVITSGLTADSL